MNSFSRSCKFMKFIKFNMKLWESCWMKALSANLALDNRPPFFGVIANPTKEGRISSNQIIFVGALNGTKPMSNIILGFQRRLLVIGSEQLYRHTTHSTGHAFRRWFQVKLDQWKQKCIRRSKCSREIRLRVVIYKKNTEIILSRLFPTLSTFLFTTRRKKRRPAHPPPAATRERILPNSSLWLFKFFHSSLHSPTSSTVLLLMRDCAIFSFSPLKEIWEWRRERKKNFMFASSKHRNGNVSTNLADRSTDDCRLQTV